MSFKLANGMELQIQPNIGTNNIISIDNKPLLVWDPYFAKYIINPDFFPGPSISSQWNPFTPFQPQGGSWASPASGSFFPFSTQDVSDTDDSIFSD
mgnify:CR=1 FL=1